MLLEKEQLFVLEEGETSGVALVVFFGLGDFYAEVVGQVGKLELFEGEGVKILLDLKLVLLVLLLELEGVTVIKFGEVCEHLMVI